jgi:glycine dehydrogenase
MNSYKFATRHIGPDDQDIAHMLKTVGSSSLDQLIDETVPPAIRKNTPLQIPAAQTEHAFLSELRSVARENKIFKTYIGLGYNDTITPGVILRNIFENPGWYTAYTPYQAEIAQGRLEALLNYQTMVLDLTGMELANASLLDEATAAAEAMNMFFHNISREAEQRGANLFFVSSDCLPQTIDVLKTRSAPLGIELVIGDHRTTELSDKFFGAVLQYPAADGQVHDYTGFVSKAKSLDIQIGVAADIMSLLLLKAPGQWGADAVFGNTQRFGVPLGYGGPHAAYFSAKEKYKRIMPGRIIGVSLDAQGKNALRMALQTREQHIRRDKATSNICTAQVLLAVIAGMYAVYHGPQGLKEIAENINNNAKRLEQGLTALGFKQLNTGYFDTLKINAGGKLESIKASALKAGINFRYIDNDTIGISLHENMQESDLLDILAVFGGSGSKLPGGNDRSSFPSGLHRDSSYLSHPVFNSYHSETEMLRYLKKLENKDLSLTHSMIPLGSCTMKLNATSEMAPLSWPEFSSVHPFVPLDQAAGYAKIIRELEQYLCEITGFSAVSLQPNSGAQGEYAGLMVIHEYHKSKGEGHRNIVLIPSSAHGTNPASAVLAGLKVVVVRCDEQGNIDVNDLREKAEAHKNDLSSLMVTYPSTHGVFEETIREITKIIHDNGGQVYMDGANMNAQVGLTSPGIIGADVCHLNLHKTFSIPHGGGGPGMGPIGVAAHLAPFLPSHPVIRIGGSQSSTAVSAAPWGSASILIISYAYIKMMGGEGLTDATRMAILNANYIKSRLESYYPVLYKGSKGRIAHEMILDCRQFKISAGVEVEDIAKRLMDYGFHAPTMSFPVPGTIMIEPTESESLAELDRFCDAMISIRKEIEEIEKGQAGREDNVLKNAPHTMHVVIDSNWKRSYSREKAVFPMASLRENKFWPTVGRVDNAYGDRNLVCACPSIENYAEELA